MGGVGVDLSLRVETDDPFRVNTAGDGVRHGACGLLGGKDGAPHHYVMRAPNQVGQTLPTKQEGIECPPGTVFEIHSAGGGGWGPPEDREPEAQAYDLRNGYVCKTSPGII